MKTATELLGSELFLLAFLLSPDLGIQLGNSGIRTSPCRPQGSHSRAKPSPWETPPSPAHYTHSGFQRSHEDLQHAGNIAVGQTNAVSQKNLANPVSHGAACHENILPLCSESAASSQEHKQCWGKIPGTAHHGGLPRAGKQAQILQAAKLLQKTTWLLHKQRLIIRILKEGPVHISSTGSQQFLPSGASLPSRRP